MTTRTARDAALVALVALPLLSGCLGNQTQDGREATTTSGGPFGISPRPTVAAGTRLAIRLTSTLSSETARVGDPWTGVVITSVSDGGRELIPAGNEVRGVVTGAQEAKRGSRAMLDLEVEEVSIDRHSLPLPASTDPVIAGSPRSRNLGAIAGGAAAGALIGKAVGGDGKDAAVGGLIGGAAATGVVAASKGYQVVLKRGTVLEFTVNEQVAMR